MEELLSCFMIIPCLWLSLDVEQRVWTALEKKVFLEKTSNEQVEFPLTEPVVVRCFCYNTGMKVLFVAGYGPITTDTNESTAFYRDSLGLSFKEEADEYFHTEELEGVNSFALWPLSQAAQSCFGTNEWPAALPTPTSWLEFDVEDVAQASEELKAKGYTLLVETRKEPWGQIVTRLLSPEGILVGLTYTPWMREDASDMAS